MPPSTRCKKRKRQNEGGENTTWYEGLEGEVHLEGSKMACRPLGQSDNLTLGRTSNTVGTTNRKGGMVTGLYTRTK